MIWRLSRAFKPKFRYVRRLPVPAFRNLSTSSPSQSEHSSLNKQEGKDDGNKQEGKEEGIEQSETQEAEACTSTSSVETTTMRTREVWFESDKPAPKPKLWERVLNEYVIFGAGSILVLSDYVTLADLEAYAHMGVVQGGAVITVALAIKVVKVQLNQPKQKKKDANTASQPSRTSFMSRFQFSKGEEDDKEAPTLKFTHLNVDVAQKANKAELSLLVDEPVYPQEVEALFEKTNDDVIKQLREGRQTRAGELLTIVKESLSEGMRVEEVQQKLIPRVFVVDYDDFNKNKIKGSKKSPLEAFTEIVSFLCSTATRYDEVVIRISSPGGSVIEYGLAGSQMLRLKKAGIRTTVCVDKVAASGGYMMACIADKIVAAPFAFMGSIGVVAEMPNLSKVLAKNDVDYLQFTAGQYKRTVGMWTELSQEGRDKFQDEVNQMHLAFKQHVSQNRSQIVDIDSVATGESWLAVQAGELVDQIATSDEYLESRMQECDVILVEVKKPKPSPFEQFMRASASSINGVWGECLRMLGLVGQNKGAGSDIPQAVCQDPKVKARF